MGSRGIFASSRPDIRNAPAMSTREFENHMIRERRIEKLAGRNEQCLVDSFLPIVPWLVGQVMDNDPRQSSRADTRPHLEGAFTMSMARRTVAKRMTSTAREK